MTTLTRSLVLILVVLLAMVGCAGLSPRLETPKLSIVGVELLKGELFEQRLRARMRVQNPNDRELAVKGITYTIELGGVTTLELVIKPEIGGGDARACVAQLRIA